MKFPPQKKKKELEATNTESHYSNETFNIQEKHKEGEKEITLVACRRKCTYSMLWISDYPQLALNEVNRNGMERAD